MDLFGTGYDNERKSVYIELHNSSTHKRIGIRRQKVLLQLQKILLLSFKLLIRIIGIIKIFSISILLSSLLLV